MMFSSEMNKCITVLVVLAMFVLIASYMLPIIKSEQEITVTKRLKSICIEEFGPLYDDYCDDMVKSLLSYEDLGDMLNEYHGRPRTFKGRTFFWVE